MESTPYAQLATWSRDYYKVAGGNPFLFFVVYGDFPAGRAISRSKYRCAGIPDGIEVRSYTKQSNSEVLANFLDGYLWEQLQKADPERAAAISQAPECIVIRGEIPDRDNLDYLRDVVGFITYLGDNGGLCV